MLKYLFFSKKIWLLLFLIFIGVFLRLWNYHNLFYYAIDEEKAAYIIHGIASGTHFPTVGHPSSIGFRLGPLLYYLLAPFYYLFGSHPIVWGYISITASIFSMLLIFKIGSYISRRTGFIALLLYVFSYLNILYDRRGWQVSFHSLLALLVLYCLINLKQQWNRFYFFLLVFTLIACSQFEVATILFIPFSILVIFLFRIHIPKRFFFLGFSIFLLFQSTLLVFDVRHNFINSKYLFNYFVRSGNERIQENNPLLGDRKVYLTHVLLPNTLARTLIPSGLRDMAIEYANCPQYLTAKHDRLPSFTLFLLLIIFISFTVMVIKDWKHDTLSVFIQKSIFVFFVIVAIGSAIYTYVLHGEMAEYYYFFLFSYFFIMLAIVLRPFTRNVGKIFIGIILLFFVYVNSRELFHSVHSYGLSKKESMVQYVLKNVKNKPFYIDSPQTCWYTGGIRYLFSYAQREPVGSYMDQYLYEYYEVKKKIHPLYTVYIFTPELIGSQPLTYKSTIEKARQSSIKNRQFGPIQVYIVKEK